MTSIRRRLIGRLLVGALLLSAAVDGALYAYLRGEIIEQYDSALASKARVLAAVVSETDAGGVDVRLSDAAAVSFRADARQRRYFQAWSADGAVAARSASLRNADLRRSAMPGRDKHAFDVELPDGRRGRAVEVAVALPSMAATRGSAPTAALVYAEDRDEVDETLAHLAWTLLASTAVLAAGTIALVVALVRDGLRPLDRMAGEAAAIDAASLSSRFDTRDLPRELAPIGERLNDLLGRIESAFQRERRFSAAVAHELRTPIAELRTLAEVGQRWPGDAAAAARSCDDALAIAVQMQAIVDNLQLLMRCEAGRHPARSEPVDVAAAIHEAWRPHAGRAGERGLAVEHRYSAGLMIDTDPSMLASMLGNLLSNAVSYAPPGGTIVCSSAAETDGVVIRIRNGCAGLTEDDLTKMAEPFWRKDAARSDPSHSGLGLSLVNAMAGALGARFTTALPSRGMFEARLAFPINVSIDPSAARG